MTDAPRLRFAPSPTGPLHLGGARTALYNWAAARARGGKYLLRIEDTDRARSTDESLRIILEGLEWFGLDWDEGPVVGGDRGPYFQTERLDIYRRYAEKLLAEGHAYECFATPEEIEEGRQALEAKGERPMYDRRHRDLSDAERDALRAERGTGSLRFCMPLDKEWVLQDLCKGEVRVNLRELDDWVMVRPDGMPTYNFACVVDDLEMGITDVVRGDEHTMNGFKQSVLFDALGAVAPRYAHIPLILGKNGKKLSKRDAVTNILEYRDLGYLPEAVFNYIALLGWSFSGDRDVFTKEEFLERFKIEDIHSSGAKFDDEKLRWMNGDYIRRLDRTEFAERCRPYLKDGMAPELLDSAKDFATNLIACYQERVEVLSELDPQLGWVFDDALEPDEKASKKLAKADPNAGQWLAEFASEIEGAGLPPSSPDERGDADAVVHLPTPQDGEASDGPFLHPKAIEQKVREFAEAREIPFGKFVQPLRIKLTGTLGGPGLGDCIYLLGEQTVLQRLRS